MSEDPSGLVDWSPYSGSAACPKCCVLGRLEVRQVFKADQLGTWSLAGVGMKLTGQIVWEYRCLGCGAIGPAEPH